MERAADMKIIRCNTGKKEALGDVLDAYPETPEYNHPL